MIKLPRIPDHLNAQWPYLPHQLRARDIEVARAVLEAAAQVCEDEAWTHKAIAVRTQSAVTNTKAIQASNCADAIRALKIEGETT
jgi:hypothetical protein